MRNIKTVAIVVTVAALLTSCASMPLSSMWKLRNLDMLSVDPHELRIAVITNKLVQLQDGSTSLTISFSSEEKEHNFSYTLLTNIDRNAQPKTLIHEIDANESLTLFYLSASEAEKLKLAQSRILAVREQEIEGGGSLSISINTGCFSSPPPATLYTDIFAHFDRDQGFIKMQSNIDLMEQAAKASESLWTQCESQTK